MKRSEFIRKGLASIAALPFTRIHGRALLSDAISLAGNLTGHEADWTFVGSKDWSQGPDGVLYSPVWNHRLAKRSDLLKREDFAYPTTEILTETDIGVEFETYYWSVVNTGIVFRAQDSGRFYVVEFADMERKGPKYSIRLFVQDSSGYRREIAVGFAPHPELPERWVQQGPKPDEWTKATPGWAKARVRAEGDRVQVFVDDRSVIDVRDRTYSSGRAGVVSRGPITLRNLKLSGKRGKLAEPWKEVGERPPYFYPWPDREK